jgi:hypothetical protein
MSEGLALVECMGICEVDLLRGCVVVDVQLTFYARDWGLRSRIMISFGKGNGYEFYDVIYALSFESDSLREA